MARLEMEIDGADRLVAALRAQPAKQDVAARKAVAQGAALIEQNIKLKLSLSSHPAGTPTPSQPGSPPSLVTGNLRRSVHFRGPTRRGRGYEAVVGPSAVYGRVQEFGGSTGRGLRTVLPARPYVRPGALASTPGLARIFGADWKP